ncbi:MAG: ATP synthase F1 subunit delta [Oscillospiraceae bacterium]|nr:ATP synthase F1 subunit delta [Oscillospiraceae bacterium]
MATSFEKVYSEALFSLVSESAADGAQEVLTNMLSELKAVEQIFADTPEFVKLMKTPVVSQEEKLELIDKAFSGNVCEYLLNFLKVLVSNHRIGGFERVVREFRQRYNNAFGIMEITVTATAPLSDDLRGKIKAKMETLTNKTILLSEKVDTTLIGGIILDYGSTRLDGSVKTRLEALKNDITNIIA